MLTAQRISYKYNYSTVLTDINVHFEAGKMYAIIGKSGSGKTTLLSLLSGISELQEGEITVDGQSISPKDLSNYRRQNSIVFQSYNLIHYLTPLQNVCIALDVTKEAANKKAKAIEYLKKVGLDDYQINRKCTELSGGQQQRVAIARAIACDSKIIFADEPTGNLDSITANEIILLLKELAEVEGKCVICVTHDEHLENYADQVIKIVDGKIINES